MCKFVILGLGSIGNRHAANLRAIRPDCRIVAADPYAAKPEPGGAISLFYRSWESALEDHADSTGVIIASPTDAHGPQLAAVTSAHIPVYCEKPVISASAYAAGERVASAEPSVAGFQYKFCQAMPDVIELAARQGCLNFYARDNLLDRYGLDVGGAMAAHPIATALWLLGDAIGVHLSSDGVSLGGYIVHRGGHVSRYDIRMDGQRRASTVQAARRVVELPGGEPNFMYRAALRAWLMALEGKTPDWRLTTLSAGLDVTAVLAQVQQEKIRA